MIVRNLKRLHAVALLAGCGALLAVPWSVSGAATPANGEAVALVKRTTARLFEALNADRGALQADPARVEPIVRDIVMPHVALEQISSLVLGKHWRTATAEEKARFLSEFRTLLVRTYSGALAGAADTEVEIVNASASDDGSQVQVRSRVRRDTGPPLALAYRLTQDAGEWQVIDIAIEGVSLVSTWRTEFTTAAARDGVKGLTDRIAARNAKG